MGANLSVVREVKDAIDLFYDLCAKIFGRPAAYLLDSYKEGNDARELKLKLGEWAAEAQDKRGRWMQPVLSKEAFETHLKKQGGQFEPSGECTSAFGWAKLLYSLNIRPKNGKERGMISWRLIPEGEAHPSKTGSISLHVHGAVLCHIINLYQTYTGSNCARDQIFELPFGELRSLEAIPKSYTFESFGNDKLSAPRQLFPFSKDNEPSNGFFKTERQDENEDVIDTTILSYFEALACNISDPSFRLDDKTHEFTPKRVKILLEAMENLTRGDFKNPYLITPAWIEHASRVKQRATTDGGKDDRLMQHIQLFMSQNLEILTALKGRLKDESDWQPLLKSTLKAMFMFKDDQHEDKYEFIWNLQIEQSSRINYGFVTLVKKHLLQALEGLSETEQGKFWQRPTANNPEERVPAEDLEKLLVSERQILSKPVLVIPHMPQDWKFWVSIVG